MDVVVVICVVALAGAQSTAQSFPVGFPVPDLQAQFITFNANYTAEVAALTSSLHSAFTTFGALAAQHPDANTTCVVQRFTECKLQIATSANFSLGWAILGEIEQQLASPPDTWPGDSQSPRDGGWGTCYRQFYLRLEATYDAISDLTDQGQLPEFPITLFDGVNSPALLLAWLREQINVDVPRTGYNTVIVANDGNSNLLRLIHKQLPATYAWHPGLWDALANFTLREWRDETSGAWGPSYSVAGGSLRVPDLSTTFHIAKYYGEYGVDVGLWDELAVTTVALVGVPFPWGQLMPDGTPLNHNLYDTATLFSLAWPSAAAPARAAMAAQAETWLNFTLTTLRGDGSWPTTRYDETGETAQYYGAGALAKFGFLNDSACFWSTASPPACRVGRSRKARSAVYDSIAAHMFGKLAANHGRGSQYISALATDLGLTIPLGLRG